MITVIIPTYGRQAEVVRCLKSLQEQVATTFELILVDNAADQNLRQLIQQLNPTFRVPVTYLPELRLGVHNARHTGAQAAKGELLVFVDDDMSFDPNWLQAYADAFAQNPDMVAAGGPVRPIWEVPPPGWLLEFMGNAETFIILSLMELSKKFSNAPDGFFFSCNMAIRRQAFFALGGFNPEAFGETWLGDGETGLNRRMWAQGMLIGYAPEALAYHHIPPQRMTVKYFRHRMANEGACEAYAHFHCGIPPRSRLLKHIAKTSIKHSALWMTALLLRGRTGRRSLRIQLDAARTQSYVRYAFRLSYDRHFRELVLREGWLNETPTHLLSVS
jgi:GT2 family glycosyltransferase